MPVGSGWRQNSPARSRVTTSPAPPFRAPILMVFTTSDATPVLSMWEPTKTTTAKGLKVTCRLDRRKYLTGREISKAQMEHLNLERNKFHGEWNYVIKPRGLSKQSG